MIVHASGVTRLVKTKTDKFELSRECFSVNSMGDFSIGNFFLPGYTNDGAQAVCMECTRASFLSTFQHSLPYSRKPKTQTFYIRNLVLWTNVYYAILAWSGDRMLKPPFLILWRVHHLERG